MFYLVLFFFCKHDKISSKIQTKGWAIMSKLKTLLTDPRAAALSFINRPKIAKRIPDKTFLKLKFRLSLKKKLNLKAPKTYNEKLQWMKLYNRDPSYIKMVDKYEVKKYVAEKLGADCIIPTLGVWDSFDEIDFSSLPDKFVLKCTHDSGGIVICQDKATLDMEKARFKIERSMKRNYFYYGREWPYKNVKPRIIAEQYMVDESGYELKDYKLFCFDGEVKIIEIDFDRFISHKRNLYSPEWDLLDMEIAYPRDSARKFERPENLDEMIKAAEMLSADMPAVRVDFYNINNRIYFGEITFFHESGMGKITPEEWDHKMGSWIKLPEKIKE